jgi:hypothetical protein
MLKDSDSSLFITVVAVGLVSAALYLFWLRPLLPGTAGRAQRVAPVGTAGAARASAAQAAATASNNNNSTNHHRTWRGPPRQPFRQQGTGEYTIDSGLAAIGISCSRAAMGKQLGGRL